MEKKKKRKKKTSLNAQAGWKKIVIKKWCREKHIFVNPPDFPTALFVLSLLPPCSLQFNPFRKHNFWKHQSEERSKLDGSNTVLRRSLVKLGLLEVSSNTVGRVTVGVCAVLSALGLETLNLLLGLVDVLTRMLARLHCKSFPGVDSYLLSLASLVLLPVLELGLDLLNNTSNSGLR